MKENLISAHGQSARFQDREDAWESPSLASSLKGHTLNLRLGNGVLLIQLPQVSIENVNPVSARNRWYFAYPPQWLLYLSAILSQLSVPTEIMDLNFRLLSEMRNHWSVSRDSLYSGIAEKVSSADVKTVCVSYMFDATYGELLKLSEYIRSIRPDIHVILGWVAASANPEKLLKSQIADTVIRYEAENSMGDFIRFSRWESDTVPNNVCFLKDGEFHSTPEKKWWGDPVDIRLEYSKIPIREYFLAGTSSMFSKMVDRNVPFATILTRRGCRWKCSFCSVRNFNGKWVRVRGISSVMEEIDFLYNRHGIRHFELIDDDFLYDAESAKELIREIKWRYQDITWSANNWLIATSVDEELLNLMEGSGCLWFKVWLESGNREILKRMHKPITVDRFHRFARMTEKFPWIFISTNFILWTPGETYGQMVDSFRAALKGSLDWNNFYIYQHFGNTEFSSLFPDVDQKQPEGSIWRENNVLHEEKCDSSFTPMANRRNNPDDPARSHAAPEESGYGISSIPASCCPNKEQLLEIWFTFNTVANFLLMPAIRTKDKKRLGNGIRWISLLSEAYPNDPLMKCLEYYLKRQSWDYSKIELDRIRENALDLLKESEYWKMRDRQFGFGQFLEGKIPEIDPRFLNFAEIGTLESEIIP